VSDVFDLTILYEFEHWRRWWERWVISQV